MKEFLFKVNRAQEGLSTLEFLKTQGVSLEIIQKVKKGGVYINDKLLLNINDAVKVGDKLKMVLPPDGENSFALSVKGDLSVIYEDEYMLVVDKESGVLTHSSKYSENISLEQLVKGYFAPNPFTFRAINRLDKDTSGIVLIAKDEYTASLLGEQMKSGEIKKTYLALTMGTPKGKKFIVEKPIKRENQNGIKRICASDGQYAKTEFEVLSKTAQGLNVIKALLHTGRTHQIRVHLASEGMPLYADALYGTKVDGESYYLHAYELEFIHPFTKQKMVFLAKPPKPFL